MTTPADRPAQLNRTDDAMRFRVSSYLGLPSAMPSFNKATRDMIHEGTGELPARLRIQLECALFLARVNKTLSLCLEESNGVPREMVRMFEDEWTAARARTFAKHSGKSSSHGSFMHGKADDSVYTG